MNEYSGVLVPIVAMMIPIVAIVGGIYSQAHARRLKADQRMAMIARGVPPAEIETYFKGQAEDDAQPLVRDPMRSLGNARRTAAVLISLGIGLTVFFLIFGAIMLIHVNQTAGWALIAVSAAGLIPLGIGIGFAVDYRLQMKEMARFGLEVGADRG
jgi:hypothetical protein